MRYFLIGLGSNIQPEHNMPHACSIIALHVDVISYSPVLINPPQGKTFNFIFHNQLLLVRSDLDDAALKIIFADVEISMGREAKTPARKFKDRPIDIDILHQSDDVNTLLAHRFDEPYNQTIMARWHDIKPSLTADND